MNRKFLAAGSIAVVATLSLGRMQWRTSRAHRP